MIKIILFYEHVCKVNQYSTGCPVSNKTDSKEENHRGDSNFVNLIVNYQKRVICSDISKNV